MRARKQVDVRGILFFVTISILLGWSCALPLWLSVDGLGHPWAKLILAVMMFTPALSTWLLVRFLKKPLHSGGLGIGIRSSAHWWLFWILAWFGIPLVTLASPLVGNLFSPGILDISRFSGLDVYLNSLGREGVPPWLSARNLFLMITIMAVLFAPLLNAIFAFGEECGWRGYLLMQLLPAGEWPALLISGAIWGIWHAPIILLGYNYPLHPYLGVALMTVGCMIWGIIFGWLRLASGSVWPPVIAHASMNGVASLTIFMWKPGVWIDSAILGPTGITGWVLPLVIIFFLLAFGVLSKKPKT